MDWDIIVARHLSKLDLAHHHYIGIAFDCALPQAWLNDVAERAEDLEYSTILSTTVWLYPSKSASPRYWLCGLPAVLCEDTARELDRLDIAYYTPRGYHGQRIEHSRSGNVLDNQPINY